jgi:hypothetical protein
MDETPDRPTRDPVRRQLRLLTGYAAVSTAALLVLLWATFLRPPRTDFGHIRAQRVDLVEPDGRLALVLSDEARLPGPILNGREVQPRHGAAGLLFFNANGDETGGLVYGDTRSDSVLDHEVHMSFDQYEDDQVLVLDHSQRGGRVATGIRVMDRSAPFTLAKLIEMDRLSKDSMAGRQQEAKRWLAEHEKEYRAANRVILGSYGGSALLQLNDTRGRPRIRMLVDSADAVSLEFLDASGKVVRRLP